MCVRSPGYCRSAEQIAALDETAITHVCTRAYYLCERQVDSLA